jgi:cation transport ATPase
MDKVQFSIAESPKISAVSNMVNAAADACCDVNHAEHADFEVQTERWDKLGLWLSSLCAIHCLATPLLVLALPVLGGFFEQEWVHLAMALFVVPVGLFAFWSGYKHHLQMRVFALGTVGLLLVGGASLAPHELVEIQGFDVVTVLGSILLITAHILNRRACLCHKHSH